MVESFAPLITPITLSDTLVSVLLYPDIKNTSTSSVTSETYINANGGNVPYASSNYSGTGWQYDLYRMKDGLYADGGYANQAVMDALGHKIYSDAYTRTEFGLPGSYIDTNSIYVYEWKGYITGSGSPSDAVIIYQQHGGED